MRCPFLARAAPATLLVAALLPALILPAAARPREIRIGAEMMQGAPALPSGVQFTSAFQGTTWFGGTVWAADSARWEAIEGGIWTFDSGVGSDFNNFTSDVNPFKDPALHTHMEGWVGVDFSYGGMNPYFRRLGANDPDWDAVCVGRGAGLGGDWSFWCGVMAGETGPLCYAAGQGYGNSWRISIEKTFAYLGGDVTLAFDYVNDTEPGWDYTYVLAETSAVGGPVELAVYTGAVSGHASIVLRGGTDLPAAPGPVTILFRVESDGAYSDEDGLYPTSCGAFSVDNVALTGGIVDGPATFESGDDGWTLSPPEPGAGGDWSDIVAMSDLPPMTGVPCLNACNLQDSVLVFSDRTIPGGGHGLYQDNMAASPWIDLRAAGVVGAPFKFIEAGYYINLPLLNYVYQADYMQWYPEVCPVTGKLTTSVFASRGFVIGWWPTVGCYTGRLQGYPIPPGAEQVRIALGVLNFCRYYSSCSGLSNTTPWYDNVRFGVYGVGGAPYIAAGSIDFPFDSFPTDGTLGIDSPGRVDCNNVKGESSPQPYSSLGDTLIVDGGTGGAEVRVQFAVDPGPGIDTGRLATWLTSHASEGTWLTDRSGAPLPWYSARMDTAEQGGEGWSYSYMTAYHEEDPNFTGSDTDLDPNDRDALGNPHLRNDIFPDDLFTPGTRLCLFYKARYDGSGQPYTGIWYLLPDTTGGNYLEMEVLPSSMGADSTFNCILYVDHADGYGGQNLIDPALRNVLAGGAANFEDVPWDRWDVRAPTSQQGSFGRPLFTQYGATVTQALGYRTILWNSGGLNSFNLVEEDAAVLIPWLQTAGPRNLYLSGDGIAQSMTAEAQSEPSALKLLNDYVGATWACGTIRDPGCPAGTLQDLTECMPTGNVTGGHFFTFPTPVYAGNGCPYLRSFDVLGPSPSALSGDARGNLLYRSPEKGDVEFAAISNLNTLGSDYRTVIDGGSVSTLRATGCTDVSAVELRLQQVLGWFGATGTNACRDESGALDAPWTPPQPTTPTLRLLSANPARGGSTIRFEAFAPRGSRVTVQVFDVAGRLVRTLLDEPSDGTARAVTWDLRDGAGRAVPGGIYFARLAGATAETRRLVVLP